MSQKCDNMSICLATAWPALDGRTDRAGRTILHSLACVARWRAIKTVPSLNALFITLCAQLSSAMYLGHGLMGVLMHPTPLLTFFGIFIYPWVCGLRKSMLTGKILCPKVPPWSFLTTPIFHVTRDSDSTFKVKGQLAGAGHLWRPPAQLVE